jgi:hypothetical protein
MNEVLRNIIMGVVVVLLLLITMAIVMSFYNDSKNQQEQQQILQTQPVIVMMNPEQNNLPSTPPVSPILPPPTLVQDIMTEFDLKSAYDPLVEATRRPPRHITLPMINNPHFNYPTRGFTDSFSLMGYLIEKDKHHVKQEAHQEAHYEKKDKENRIVKLFGRQKYPNSTEYEYYVTINTGYNDNIKYSLENQRKELYDGDSVFIDILHKNYRVKLLKNRIFEYNPYAI